MEEAMSSNLDVSKISSINVISPDKNLPRRKSSIFNRRSTFMGDENMQFDGSSSEMIDRSKSESDFNVETYLACLQKEVSDWKTLYEERKKARTLARKRQRLKNVVTSEEVYAIFSEEDKKFVRGRPDYSRMGKDAIVAMEKFSIALQTAICVEKSSQLVINYVQKTETDLRKKIIEMSVLE